ncbi:MAG: sulfotransferase domain-containing protein [Flavobacteriales bacterium]|nr:sulfotransferase domain-containing protein [Flavobacteriales bacterium]HMN04882.1 sulfotransferase domain-containing protein [Flavobacteriales bacterium]
MNQIAIFSVPRSGSTWLGQIFNSHPEVLYRFQPNMAYSFPLTLSESSTEAEIQAFFEALRLTEDPFTTARISISGKPNPQFAKTSPTTLVFKETHYLYIIDNLIRNSGTRVIGLVRSPFATMNSWIKAPKEFHPEWDLEAEWLDAPKKNLGNPRNFFGYNKWKEGALLFLELQGKYPDRFMSVQYERLLAEKLPAVESLFRFCGLSMTEQTRAFIARSESKDDAQDTYSVFRTKTNDLAWKNGLPTFITEAIMADPEFQTLNKHFCWA